MAAAGIEEHEIDLLHSPVLNMPSDCNHSGGKLAVDTGGIGDVRIYSRA
jgi:hypothetical protein